MVNYGATVQHLVEQELESRSGDCDDFSLDGGCFAVISYSATIVYQGCPILVTADYQICQQQGLVTYLTIANFHWTPTPTDPSCVAVFAAIQNLPPQQQAAALDDLQALLSKQLEEQLATAVLATFIGVDCGGVGSNISTSFFEADCRAWCFGAGDLGGGFTLSYISCGTSCCKRSSVYCYDFENGVLKELSSSVELTGPECPTPSGQFCLGEDDNICSNPCERLN